MFWRTLNTPQSFDRDWYGELTNQCGHTLMGVVATLAVIGVWREAAGSMPHRGIAFALVCLPYVVLFEWHFQRWKPGDSWFDTLMLMFGSLGVLVPFREVSTIGAYTYLKFDHRAALVLSVVWAAALFLRVFKRYRAQHGTD